jgi:hypothetical protein
MNTSLFVIEYTLSDLMEAREQLRTEVAFTPEQVEARDAAVAEIDKAIKEYLAAEVRKADNIARYLQDCEARALAKRREAERLRASAERDEARAARVKEIVLGLMQQFDLKKIEGQAYTLKRQGNGGVRAVDVAQPDMVPEKYLRVTVTMSVPLWRVFCEDLSDAEMDEVNIREPEPDKEAIRKQLETMEACPECGGPPYPGQVEDDKYFCGHCGGKGKVPRGVPGCSLKERGEQLRVG